MCCDRVVMCVLCAVFILHTDIVSGGEGVKIKELRVPEVVLNGTEKPVVLDCDYVLDIPASQSGLVVKWFFNNHPASVYQWIYGKKPQVMGVLKGRVNLDYHATEDESTMFRALQILNPTTELSGEYKCLISTFDKEVSQSKKMIVYVKEKSLEMTEQKINDGKVIINCTAEGVFPEPNMDIVAEDSKRNGIPLVTTKKRTNSSLYDVKGSLTIDDADLNSPTIFTCELTIPDAHYSKQSKLTYFPASGSSLTPSLLSVLFLTTLLTLRSTGL